MRAVHAYIDIKHRTTTAFKSEVDLAVWKLSVLRNKALGFTTVLYTTEADIDFLKAVGLYKLYDEVHTVWDSRYEQINIDKFWAAFKFIAIEHEIKRNEQFFVMDTDLVFTDDYILRKLRAPMLNWLNSEPMHYYCKLDQISYPPNFKFPYYFSAFIRPINTAIIKCDNNELLKEWLDIAWRYMIDNPCDKGSTWMCTVEQRFLANVIKKYKIEHWFMCDSVTDNFGPHNFHTWGNKKVLNENPLLSKHWLKGLALLIRQESEEAFTDMFAHPMPKFQQVILEWDRLTVPKILRKYLKKEEE